VNGQHEPNPGAFGDQPDPAKEHFVQPKAVAMLRHRGCEYVMFRKRDGTLAAGKVMRPTRRDIAKP
jgi:hypothetical protein